MSWDTRLEFNSVWLPPNQQGSLKTCFQKYSAETRDCFCVLHSKWLSKIQSQQKRNMREGAIPSPLTLEGGYIGADTTTSLLGTRQPLPSLVHDVQAKVWLRSAPGRMIQTKHVHKSPCGSGLNVSTASIETAIFFQISCGSKHWCVVYKPLPRICYIYLGI